MCSFKLIPTHFLPGLCLGPHWRGALLRCSADLIIDRKWEPLHISLSIDAFDASTGGPVSARAQGPKEY